MAAQVHHGTARRRALVEPVGREPVAGNAGVGVAGADQGDLAEGALFHHLLGELHAGTASLGIADDEGHAGLLHGLLHVQAFRHGGSQGLLGEDVLPGLRGLHQDVPVSRGGRVADNGLDVVPGQQGVQIGDEFRAQLLRPRLAARGVVVPYRDDLRLAAVLQHAGISARVHVPFGEHCNFNHDKSSCKREFL